MEPHRCIRRLSHLLILIGSIIPTTALGWGPMGHSIVGQVGSRHLTPEGKKLVREILGDQTLAQVSSWADGYRPSHPETKEWHFVDIPIGMTDYEETRDCQPKPEGDCAIKAIDREMAILSNPNADTEDRKMALKFIVHFIGDIHQPLHAADDNDHGGNGVHVRLLSKSSNLHSVWDGGILANGGMSEAQYVRRAQNWLTQQDIDKLQSGTDVDWVDESHGVAVAVVYGQLPRDHKLSTAYISAMRPVVQKQLALGGIRLAAMINRAAAQQPS